MRWSPRLHRGNQVGLIPTSSTKTKKNKMAYTLTASGLTLNQVILVRIQVGQPKIRAASLVG